MQIDWSVLSDPVMIARLALQVALFMGSALFSMSETALFSLRPTDLERLRDQGAEADADRLSALLDEPRRLIVSILCGNELINIAATINLAGIFLALFGDPATASVMNTAVMLPLLLLFGEITPKTLAVTAPVPISRKLIGPVISVWVQFVAPLRAVVRIASDRLTTMLVGEARDGDNILSEDEFSLALEAAESDGAVSPAERRLIANLIAASSMPITTIMVPRPQVAFLHASLPPKLLIERFRALRHRRVPVCGENRDDIVGVMREERVMKALRRKPEHEITLEDLVDPPHLAPETMTVADLAEFLKDGQHFAVIVINEFGGVEGFATTDDVFAFLTSGRTIHLERFEAEEAENGKDVWTCHGLTPISSLRTTTGLPLELDAGVHTAGGLMMALLGRMPRVGDQIQDGEARLTVTETDGLLVRKLRVERRAGEEA